MQLKLRLTKTKKIPTPQPEVLAPTSESRMSKIVRDLESLGKSIGKKWSHILLLTRSSESDGRSDVTDSLECPDKFRVS